jgi:hypothetical protein
MISLAFGPAQYADGRHSPCVQIELYAGMRTRVGLLYAGSRIEQTAYGIRPSVWSLLSFGSCTKTSRYHQVSENQVTRLILYKDTYFVSGLERLFPRILARGLHAHIAASQTCRWAFSEVLSAQLSHSYDRFNGIFNFWQCHKGKHLTAI